MKRVTILGATGSVGTSTLDLIERNPDDYAIEALTAHRDVAKLAAAARRVGARLAVVGDERCLPALHEALAFEAGGNNGGKPVASVAFEFQVFAGQARADDGFELIGSHVRFRAVTL